MKMVVLFNSYNISIVNKLIDFIHIISLEISGGANQVYVVLYH